MLKKYLPNYLLICVSLFTFLILAGCSDKHNDSNSISGSAIKGVISNGIVKAYSASQPDQLLAQSRTNQYGQYTLNLPLTSETITTLLLELSVDETTRMRCDLTIGCTDQSNGQLIAFGDEVQLPEDFKLLGFAYRNGNTNSFITPLSHLIVSTALQNSPNLTNDSIKMATSWVNDVFKLSQSPIQTQPKDITQLLNLISISDEQLKQSILSAALYPDTLEPTWSTGDESIDSIDLQSILTRAAELAGDLSILIEESSPNQALALNKIQSDTEAQLVILDTSEVVILTQPRSVTTTENDVFNLYVQANSNLALNYQWYKNGSLIPGANSAIYSKQNSKLLDSGLYHVIVSNDLSELSSLSAIVTVKEVQLTLQITQQPQGLSITEGEALSLSVSVIGDGEIQYQWQKNGSLIPGATSNSYYIPNSQTQDAGSYRVLISNNSKQINSNFVNVWVTEVIQAISISQQPQSQVIPEGNDAKFTVSANGGGFTRYQWRKNGVDIPNAFSTSLNITSVNRADNGTYDVVISNSQGSLISASASLEVLDNNIPLMITHQPQTQSVLSGTPFTLSVGAAGDGPLSYQWLLNGNVIDSVNSAQYQVLSASSANQGNYSVVVKDANSAEFSDSAYITITQTQLGSIELTWDTPTEREDGSALNFNEVQGYVIEYGTNAYELQNSLYVHNEIPNSSIISDLLPGTLLLRIATVDSDDVQGAFSETISITIP